MRGLIFDVQRYSTHDGPGIRTTVFSKGCPMRCPWCHNPESISPNPELLFWSARCIGCLECVKTCPNGAILATGKINRSQCKGCGSCAAVCPSGALELSGYWVEPTELVKELSRDRKFYQKSGGGVTFSGGETLLQPVFLLEALKLCKDGEMSTAVDTSGEVPWEVIETVLPYTDLFLYDVKPISSARSLDNLRKLTASGARIQIRVPVIPSINDTPEAMLSIADTVREHEVCLLPFHRLGAEKYAALGLDYRAEKLTPPAAETMAALAEALKDCGCSVIAE